MRYYFSFIVCLTVCFAGLVTGCNNQTLPIAIIDENEPSAESFLVELEASSINPSMAMVGEQVTIRRGSGTFPAGFYRVTFTGGAETNFFSSGSSSDIVVTVPSGALSGPFGFTVGAAPSDGVDYGGPSSATFRAYTIKAPGLVVESDGSFSF